MKEGRKPRNWGVHEISLLGRYLQAVKGPKWRIARQEADKNQQTLKKTFSFGVTGEQKRKK